MEVDNDTSSNAAISAVPSEAELSRSPLALNLGQRCSILLEDLGVTAGEQTASLPIDVAQFILDYTNQTSPLDHEPELLDALSMLASVEGVSASVYHAFGPILLDLFARWSDDKTADINVLEARLVALTSVAALRPDLWTYVIFSVDYSKTRLTS
jgi:midasin